MAVSFTGHACGNAVFFGIHLEFLRGIDTSMIRVKNANRGITLTYRLFERVKSESDKGDSFLT